MWAGLHLEERRGYQVAQSGGRQALYTSTRASTVHKHKYCTSTNTSTVHKHKHKASTVHNTSTSTVHTLTFICYILKLIPHSVLLTPLDKLEIEI